MSRCGRPTLDGTPCKNPRGCKADHRAAVPLSVGSRMAAISAAAAVSTSAFDDYAHDAATDVIAPLSDEGFTHETRAGSDLRVSDILTVLQRTQSQDGFTLSPRRSPSEPYEFATEGICVAIPGSDMHLPADMFEPDTGVPSDAAHEKLSEFYEHLKPLRDTGHVWIGGWRNNEGVFELNASLVLHEEDRQHATRLAHQWRQESVFDLGRGEVIDIGGDGGESIYDQPGRLQRWFRRR